MKSLLALTFLVFVTAQQVVSQDTNKSNTDDCPRKLHKKHVSKWRLEEASADDDMSTRQDFSPDVEAAINKQINTELYASYTYLSMAHHFDRFDRHLPGFSKFFMKAHEEENKHAQMLMKYQNMRGGRIKLNHIEKPCKDDWDTGLAAMKTALALEKRVNRDLFDLHAVAASRNDNQCQDFIEGNFLNEQVESIKEIANFVNTLNRLKDYPLGEYQFDKVTLAA